MKLAILTRAFPPDVISGRETVIYNLWRQAVLLDDVTLISGWRNRRSNLPENCLPIDQSSRNRFLNYFRFFMLSAAIVRRLQLDAVLSSAIEVGPVGVPAAVIVYDLNFGLADSLRGTGMLRRTLVGWRIRHFQAVIAISHATGVKVQQLGVGAGRIHVVYPGVDLDRFRPASESDGDGEGQHLTITYPGRIVFGKGQHLLLEALSLLPSDLLNRVRCVIVGRAQDVAYLSQLRELASGLSVTFHTDVEDIVSFYQDADIVVFPTMMEEGFGLTAAEALACGKPVIYANYPAIREATGGIGLPVTIGDADALAQAMQELLRDPDRRHALGRDGLAHARTHYDWAGTYQQYRRVLESLGSDRV